MLAYCAFLWNPLSQSACAAARVLTSQFQRAHPSWTAVPNLSGIAVFLPHGFDSRKHLTLVPGQRGVILGDLFPTDTAAWSSNWRAKVSEATAEQVLRTAGRKLIDDFWGGYVALLNTGRGTSYVLREPGAQVPCFVLSHKEVECIFANVQDLGGLGLPVFSINRRFLAGFFYNAEFAHRDCAINEIKEVLPGDCYEISGGSVRIHLLWDPRKIAKARSDLPFEHASRRLHAVTRSCIHAWASKFERIVLQLSGGLDSAIVLGCIRDAATRPTIVCRHLHASGKDHDERVFARAAAQDAGVELVEQAMYSTNAAYDARILNLPIAAKPSVAHVGLMLDLDERNAVPAAVKAQAIWDGQGGDHLFFESKTAFPAIDWVFSRGILRMPWMPILDAALRSRMSYWGVVAIAVRQGLLRQPWHPEELWRRDLMFLNRDVPPGDLVQYIWEWLGQDWDTLPPGKRYQIAILGELLNRHRPVPGLEYAPEHHPLFSRPIIDECLRTPTYTLLRGGIDRALARHAFRNCVPRSILARQGKGGTATTVMSKIREGLPFLRELILGGVLAQEKILDVAALEPYFSLGKPVDDRSLWPFLSCIGAEVWARKWAECGWKVGENSPTSGLHVRESIPYA